MATPGPWVKHFVLYWLPVMVWMGVIFLISSLPKATLRATRQELTNHPALTNHSAYGEWLTPIGHTVEFAVLAVLLYRLLTSYPGLGGRYVLGGAFVLTVSYGLTDELHQYFVPGRNVSVVDIALDGLGALIGLMLAVQWTNLQGRLRRKSGT